MRINLYGVIGDWWGGYTADTIIPQIIEGLEKDDHIDLHVNSEGGSVFEAVAIYNELARNPSKITAYVDGLAASAASFVIQGAGKIVVGRGSLMMVHSPSAVNWGDAESMRETARLLDKVRDDTLVPIYQTRMSKTAEEIVAILAAETWYSDKEAVEAGLATEVAATTQAQYSNELKQRIAALHYRNVPKQLRAEKVERKHRIEEPAKKLDAYYQRLLKLQTSSNEISGKNTR